MSTPPPVATITVSVADLVIALPAQSITLAATGSTPATLTLSLPALAAALQPFLTTSGPAASPSGAVIPPLTQITDAAGASWTVVGGVVYVNGGKAGFSANVTELVYFAHVIYQFNGATWWAWTGTTWVSAPKDPRT